MWLFQDLDYLYTQVVFALVLYEHTVHFCLGVFVLEGHFAQDSCPQAILKAGPFLHPDIASPGKAPIALHVLC